MPLTSLTEKENFASFRCYWALLATIFVAELALMEFLSFWSNIDSSPVALLDAGLLVALFSVPLMLLGRRIRFEQDETKTPWAALFGIFLAGLFLIQFALMFFLQRLVPLSSPHLLSLLDASLTLLLSAPLLWWLFLRLGVRRRPAASADALAGPMLPFILLLALVFIVGLHIENMLPFAAFGWGPLSARLANAGLATLVIAPALWFVIGRPLQQSAASERTRTLAVYAQVVDAVITFGPLGRIGCFNPAAQRIFGYSEDEVGGEHISVLFEDGLQILEHLVKTAMSSNGAPVRLASKELRCCRSDGLLIPMDVSISRLLIQGKPEFLLIMRDVSERRRATENLLSSENRFRQLFEQSDDAILFLHPRNHSIIDVNATAVNMFGYTNAELVAGNMELVCPPHEYEKLQTLLEKIDSEKLVQIDRLAGCRKDGTEMVLSMRVKIMRLLDVQILYCTMRDVTDRVSMESEAREIQSKLIHASKMTALGLMVSGVAHEINNPNNYILSNAQLLERWWRDARIVLKEYQQEHGDFLLGGRPFSTAESDMPGLTSSIVDGSRRISEIITNLKAFARQEAVPKVAEIDMNSVAKTAISILHHEIVRHTGDFSFQPTADLPKVMGNRQQLGQVIINLLMNACQALPDKTRGVQVQTYLDPGNGQVVVEVQDQGAGMPAETARLVMEPFFTTKLDSGGTGLGLSICRTIIRDHHGTLDFESEPDVGTTFFIRLPPAGGAETGDVLL